MAAHSTHTGSPRLPSAPGQRPRPFFPLWSKQIEYLESTAPVRGFVGGQGAGKTRVGVYDVLCRAKGGRSYMVTAPTYGMLRDSTCRSFSEVARYTGQLAKPIGGEALTATVRCLEGGTADVLFRSTDNPDRLRGPNLSGALMDEASQSVHEAYQILSARLREKAEAGWLGLAFTPQGRLHWTYSEVFGKPGRTDTFLVQAATKDNPFVSEQFLANVQANYAGLRAMQELEGLFVQIEGAEWPPEYFPDSMWFADWPRDLVIRSIGIDPSKGKDAKAGDYCAIVMLGRCREGHLWCEADLFRRPAEFIVHAAADWQGRFKADVIAVEANQFQELLAVQIGAEVRRRGVGMPLSLVVNTVNKQVRIRRLGPHLSRGSFRFRDTHGTRLLVEQLRNFPECDFDDGCDAAEMALRAMVELWNSRHAHPPRR